MTNLLDAILYECLYQDKLQRYQAYGWHFSSTREQYATFPLPDVLKDRTARNDWRIGG